jgi:polyferredoxin
MLFALVTRRTEGITVIHDRNPIFVRLSDGGIRNAYTVHILNKANEMRTFQIKVDGLDDAALSIIGDASTHGNSLVVVGPDQTRELRVLVTTHASLPPSASIPVTFTIADTEDGTAVTAVDNFVGP